MSSSKRVSFGENGSMVETLIIDNSNMPAEEKHFYQENILRGNVTADLNKGRLKDDVEQPPAASSNQQGNGHRVTFAEAPVEHTTTVIQNESVNGASSQMTTTTSSQVNQSSSTAAPAGSPTQGTMPAPVIRLQRTRSMESHENPFMAGGELDSKADYIIRHSKISRTEIRIADPDSPQPQEEIQMETIEKVEAAPVSGAAPGGNPKENGKVEDPLKPQNVEVEVDKANASQPETQEPEQVKSKDKKPKCKCCVIQ